MIHHLRMFSRLGAYFFACFVALTVSATANAQNSSACSNVTMILQSECPTLVHNNSVTDTPYNQSNQLIIGISADISDQELLMMLDEQGYILNKRWEVFGSALVERKQETRRLRKQAGIPSIEQARLKLVSQKGVHYAEYNVQLTSGQVPEPEESEGMQQTDSATWANDFTPNDPEFPNQWALSTVRAVEGWTVTQGDPNVVIAIVDSGFNLDHPDFDSSRLWVNEVEATGKSGVDDDGNGYIDDIWGWDWVDGDNTANDLFGHGSHNVGTIAATTNNQIGISGSAQTVKVMPLRILGEHGEGRIAALLDALSYVIDQEVQIVNLGVITSLDNRPLRDAIKTLSNQMVVVTATGNSSSDVTRPAAYPETIAVAATDRDDTRAKFSGSGPEVDVAAPGVDILSIDDESGYVENTGTSMAGSYVSTLAALIASLRPDFSPEQIRATIENSAVDINAKTHPGVDEFIGHGRIDMYQALLDASIGLQLKARELSSSTGISDTVTIEIQVQTPNNTQRSIPVANAVIRYDIISDSSLITGTAVLPPGGGYVLTDADGTATVEIVGLSSSEDYVLQTKVGQAVAEFSFPVQQEQAEVGEAGAGQAEAGSLPQVEQRIWLPFMSEEQ